MDAFNDSDYLAVEVNESAADEKSLMAYIAAMSYQDGRKLKDDLDDELVERLAEALGIPVEDLNTLTPFGAFLFSGSLAKSSLKMQEGLDVYFIQRATKNGMEIFEIESLGSQLEMFGSFSMPLWEALLEDALDTENASEQLRELYNAWRLGDEERLQTAINSTVEGLSDELAEEYTNAMLTKRDIHMAEVAKKYMEEGKSVFYVVGAAHLIGENSVIGLLEKDGYEIELIS